MSWPQLPQVALDELTGKVVGYVLAKMEDEDESKAQVAHGHITSISVLRDYRKLGIATKLMRAAQHQMKTVYGAKYCSLHVRVSNRAAITLYKDVLGFEVDQVADEYYADKEDAYDMKLYFDQSVRAQVAKKAKKGGENLAEMAKAADAAAAGSSNFAGANDADDGDNKGEAAAASNEATADTSAAAGGGEEETNKKKKKKKKNKK